MPKTKIFKALFELFVTSGGQETVLPVNVPVDARELKPLLSL